VKVPVELVVYPGEGHGLTTYENRKAKMEWDLAWFERYLSSTPQPEKKEPPIH
jgi:dipeptidyl aminopeptidase/acylaminoacyl peptidase